MKTGLFMREELRSAQRVLYYDKIKKVKRLTGVNNGEGEWKEGEEEQIYTYKGFLHERLEIMERRLQE